MPYYIPATVSKNTCIGNTLSTFNISFTSLDKRLYELSTYIDFLSSTVISVSSVLDSRINFLSSTMISISGELNNRINFLSSSMISVSGDLRTQINTTSSDLKTQINYISANAVNNYINQGVLTNIDSQINWNFSTVGTNAKIDLFSNARLNNPTGLLAGQTGNLIVEIGTAGRTLTSFGNLWTFVSLASTLTTTLSAKNVISYYYDGEQLLSSLIRF